MTAAAKRVPALVAILGPTASGKSVLAERLASHLDAVLVSADAFQVYRGFDIGTAKPRDRAKYRLIDILEPQEPYGVGDFVIRASGELNDAWERRQSVVVVGGTGLYVRALTEEYRNLSPMPDLELRKGLERKERDIGLEALAGELARLDPAAASKTDLRNPVRVRRALEKALSPVKPLEFKLPAFQLRKIGLDPDSAALRERIGERVDKMMQNGWVREVGRLKDSGVDPSYPAMRAIGYRTIWRHLEGGLSEKEAAALIVAETARYAKRQRTWLRSEPRTHTLIGFGDSNEAFDLAVNPMK